MYFDAINTIKPPKLFWKALIYLIHNVIVFRDKWSPLHYNYHIIDFGYVSDPNIGFGLEFSDHLNLIFS